MRENADHRRDLSSSAANMAPVNAVRLRLTAVLAGTLLALGLLTLFELALRMSHFSFSAIPRQVSVTFSEDIVADMNTRSGNKVFERDHELLWRLVPGASVGIQTVNSAGFFGPEFGNTSTRDHVRMICLGDSCTALGIDPYPSRLANDLAVALGDRSARILNAGVPGYSSLQGRRLLARLVERWPIDVVSINFGWNDHWQALHLPDKQYGQTAPVVAKLQNLVSVLRTYQLLHYLLKPRPTEHSGHDEAQASRRVSALDFADNIRTMTELCQQRSILPILITAPMNRALFVESTMGVSGHDQILRHRQDEVELHDRYNEIIRRVADETDTSLIDADELFTRENEPFLFMDDGIHFGPVGAQGIADELLDALVRHLLIDERTRLFAKTRRVFSSWRPHRMLASMACDRQALSGPPDSTQHIELRMINSGDTIWNRDSPYPFAMVRIGVSLMDERGSTLVRDYARFDLPEDCLPGETLAMPLSIQMPQESGDYILSIDGVNEGIGWFSKWGSTPLHIPVHISDASPQNRETKK